MIVGFLLLWLLDKDWEEESMRGTVKINQNCPRTPACEQLLGTQRLLGKVGGERRTEINVNWTD